MDTSFSIHVLKAKTALKQLEQLMAEPNDGSAALIGGGFAALSVAVNQMVLWAARTEEILRDLNPGVRVEY